jgi:methylene-tetrahydrofolate reductase-like protein
MPFRPRLTAALSYRLHALLATNSGYRWLAAFLERHPRLYRWFTAAERVGKQRLFGCQMCGQCALPATGYACPMTCPKQLRNGPCGGVSPTGQCEVVPELRCVWLIAYERAEAAGHGSDLDSLHRPIDQREWGRSSWVNYWHDRDEELWTSRPNELPILRREPESRPR